MPTLSPSLIQAHLNLDPDIDTDLLAHYATVAEMWVAAYTGTPFDPDNALMIQAALLLVAHMYETREAITFSNAYSLPYGVHELLSPLKERVTGYIAEPA